MDKKILDNCTVMFADVAGSTKLYDELGDNKANTVISKVIHLMQSSVNNFDGRVIKTIGDEVMCCFNSCENAAKAAIEIQEKLELGLVDGTFVSVRIGFHTGSVIVQEDGDLFGDTVNLAARMAGVAKGRQIILSTDTADGLTPQTKDKTRHFDRVKVKGKAKEMRISQLVWENVGVTRMVSVASITSELDKSLTMTIACEDFEAHLTQENNTLEIGRSDECDLVVQTELASRAHAKITIKRGKFVLIDQSTNGTFVEDKQGNINYIRRDEVVLSGTGRISLGQEPNSDIPANVIHYEEGLLN